MLTREKNPFDDEPERPEPDLRARLKALENQGRELWQSLRAANGNKLLSSLAGIWHDPLYVRLPFEEKRLGLTLAALLAITLYVAFLAIATNSVLSHAAQGMDFEVARRMTFEVLPDPAHPGDVKEKLERAGKLAEHLKTVPGVKSVTPLSEAKMTELLAPWLGSAAPPSDLPLPALIDVELEHTTPAVKDAINKEVAPFPNVMTDDHAAFSSALFRTVHGLGFTAFYVLLLGFAALLLTATFAAETHFHINRETIEILHIIGARDSAIARHMGFAVLRMSAAAVAGAFALGVITLIVLLSAMRGLDLSLFPNFSMGPLGWIGIVLQWLMAGAASLIMCYGAAHISVLRALRRMI